MSISTFMRAQWQGIVVGLGLCLFAAGVFVIGSQILTPFDVLHTTEVVGFLRGQPSQLVTPAVNLRVR